MTHSAGATQGRKPPPEAASGMEMKSQACEAFARTGQDISSVKSCPRQCCSGIPASLHRPVLCTSQLKALCYSTVQGGLDSPAGFLFISLLPLCSQLTTSKGKVRKRAGHISLLAPKQSHTVPITGCTRLQLLLPRPCRLPAPAAPGAAWPGPQQRGKGSWGLLCLQDTESTVSTASPVPHAHGIPRCHHLPSLSA